MVCLVEKMAHPSTLVWPFLGRIPGSGVNSELWFPLPSCEDTIHRALAHDSLLNLVALKGPAF